MLEPSSQKPNFLIPQVSPTPAAPPPPMAQPPPSPPPPSLVRTYSGKLLSLLSERPSLRATSEFDSDSRVFFHKVSCKLFDNLASLKLSFINDSKREISEPQLMLTSKYLSIHYDPDEQNALIRTSFDVGPMLNFNVAHDLKAQQGEVSMYASLPSPGFGVQVSSSFPYSGLPRATIRFPMGEVTLEEREEADVLRTLSVKGILRGQILNGVCSAHYVDEELKLRYIYKDQAMSFIPSISIPSNAVSFAFKRRLSPSDKLSYWYKLYSNNWSAVYKHTYKKSFKLKAGYDSEVRLGWASIWVGDKNGRARTAPMKMKVQFMLQVPQDDIKSSTLMFRVKKRWDIL
ncbi:outer envelope pore protein 37, chloroplastic [Gossypium raimondii]|uniref:Outer envelope pore protein 37, chloroplastic n=1 Tax=Gossypium raimondii TaxID=29730 RepID=A0A0D2TDF0_GOSRA|nr:outer envelope pore protein 37, chloroplastic [Gossypium raimondii]KJB52536.1 hypothetical protein B456_008G266600 [Gossypium raimondii]MBA0593589.1 hypothetical protein [Gossypium raimondii]